VLCWALPGHHLHDPTQSHWLDFLQMSLIFNYIIQSRWKPITCWLNLKQVHVSDGLLQYITYTVQMRRKPLFYVFNMIMPCFIITLISLLGFYIPSNSGEKVSMGITTLLSMTVFLMLVAENMPPTSDVLPLVGKKIIMSRVLRIGLLWNFEYLAAK